MSNNTNVEDGTTMNILANLLNGIGILIAMVVFFFLVKIAVSYFA